MAGSYRLTAVEREQRIAAEWPSEMPSLRQWVILLVGWLMFALLAPVIVIMSALYEALCGIATGAFKGTQECHRMIRTWIETFEGDGR